MYMDINLKSMVPFRSTLIEAGISSLLKMSTVAYVDEQLLNKKEEEEEALLSFLQQNAEFLRDASNGTPKAFGEAQDRGSRKISTPGQWCGLSGLSRTAPVP